MKINIRSGRADFLNWFFFAAVSAEDGKIAEITHQEVFDSENIDMKLVVNGVEINDLEDVFARVQQHIEAEAERLANLDSVLAVKLDQIRSILER